MKKLLTLSILLALHTLGIGQTAYNPFTQNIHFAPEPSPAGFECNSTQTVVFNAGLTTAADATQWQANPMSIVVCIAGFQFNGPASSVVGGSYAAYFNWAYDALAPNCIVGVQNQTLHGTGTNPAFPDPLSSGDLSFSLKVPDTSPIGTILSVNVSLLVPAYMQPYNSIPDDNESSLTQTYCPLKISGTVFNDRNNDGNVNGFPIYNPDSINLFAHLVDSNNIVVQVVPVGTDGHYSFLNVPPYSHFTVVTGMIQGTPGSIVPSADLPGTWVHTGEDCCDETGTDGSADGITSVYISNFSVQNVDFGIKDPNAFDLPYTLKNFFVSEYKCQALLSWTTATEENTSHTDIYRRQDGSGFVKVATLPSAGHSVTDRTYTWLDESIHAGTTYEYQLRFVDIDQQYSVSEIKSLSTQCIENTGNLQFYPNPVQDVLHILFVSETDGNPLDVQLCDVSGRMLYTKTLMAKAGANAFTIDMRSLSSGTYFLKYQDQELLQSNSIPFTRK
ncbi:MAG TPA: T9SS type A sorting domain-containing protein [Chitinophagaceae bacterium]|nr:T9SS type A sorting domain-containing protein [Chitinophagaceae bacterium]